jgi:dienelactone hydrolase
VIYLYRYFLIALCTFVQNSISQVTQSSYKGETIIDSHAVNNWIRFDRRCDPTISANGKFFAFVTTTGHYEARLRERKLTVQSTESNWKYTVPVAFNGAINFFFSSDSKKLVFFEKNTVNFLTLGNDEIDRVPNIRSLKRAEHGNRNPIAYLANDSLLTISYIDLNEDIKFNKVIDFFFSPKGNSLGIIQQTGEGKTQVLLFNTSTKVSRVIWKDTLYLSKGLVFDQSGRQVAFFFQKSKSTLDDDNGICYYSAAMQTAEIILPQNCFKQKGLSISSTELSFTNKGHFVLFNVLPMQNGLKNNFAVYTNRTVEIWNYMCPNLRTLNENESFIKPLFATINLNTRSANILLKESEVVVNAHNADNYIVVRTDTVMGRFWKQNEKMKYSNWLVSLKDGSRIPLPSGGEAHINFWFSPNSNYLLYYLSDEQHYYSLNLVSKKTIRISAGIEQNELALIDEFEKPNIAKNGPLGVANWNQPGSFVYVYGQYDIWQLDLAGKKRPVNITNRFGYENKIKLRSLNTPISNMGKMTLVGFSYLTKWNGFFQVNINQISNPKPMAWGPFSYYLEPTSASLLPLSADLFDGGIDPVKADSADVWLLTRQSAVEAPNFFISSDLKNLKQLTFFEPQKDYNWLTAELVRFRQTDGSTSEGILYKPENFDSSKKYPVLICYYRQRSHRLFNFPYADYAHSVFNIPWFVSRGYLVFTPDIYFYRPGGLGRGALNTVAGAGKYLKQIRYVDSNKIGINGHSVAGGLANYIISNCNMFAAAISGAGVSSSISGALKYSPAYATSRLEGSESYAFGGANMWDSPDLYLENSSILKAKSVSTPLLLLHCKADPAVPWDESFAFFTALWRWEKPVYLIDYEKGDHVVGGADALDFSLRITQFYDHYLKNAPKPDWMTYMYIKNSQPRLNCISE